MGYQQSTWGVFGGLLKQRFHDVRQQKEVITKRINALNLELNHTFGQFEQLLIKYQIIPWHKYCKMYQDLQKWNKRVSVVDNELYALSKWYIKTYGYNPLE